MITDIEIQQICENYDIKCTNIGDIIDTSKSENDRRYIYEINYKYFLKITNFRGINQSNLEEILQLIERYNSIGVYCPSIIRSLDDKLSITFEKNDVNYICYIEEKAIFSTCENNMSDDIDFRKEVLEHLGILATKYTNINLVTTKSMWSIIELNAYDSEVDEKQENLNDLVECLNLKGFDELSDNLKQSNDFSRTKINEYLNRLPRCTYQGDLNYSNLLVSEDMDFKGLIDFNMYGTEVNINCFLNESMYYITMEDFIELSGRDIYFKIIRFQQEMISTITMNYRFSLDELEVIDDYRRIIFLSFYPNVSLMIHLLRKGEYKEKVISLLDLIVNGAKVDYY